MRFRHAFTLIELLIVVAIIAILAAIAVPNFLEAQTRAKVSRVKSDMRTIGVATEAYAVDYNKLPFDFADDVAFPYYTNNGLTSPVAFLSNARLEDTFATKVVTNTSNAIRERFRYRAFNQSYLAPGGAFPKVWGGSGLPGCVPTSVGSQTALQVHGAWFLVSKGPDAKLALPTNFNDGQDADDWLWLPYDATNGTISSGDVIRGQSGDVGERGYPRYATSYTDR